jgi:hypothetical protein
MTSITKFLLDHRSRLLMGICGGLVLITPLGESHPNFGGVIALLIFILMLVGANYMASRRIVCYALLPVAAL